MGNNLFSKLPPDASSRRPIRRAALPGDRTPTFTPHIPVRMTSILKWP